MSMSSFNSERSLDKRSAIRGSMRSIVNLYSPGN